MLAVLQAWSKSSFSQRITGLIFVIALGFAAHWGARLLKLIH